jgi:hypothetical protein
MRRSLIEHVCPDSLGRPVKQQGCHAVAGAIGSNARHRAADLHPDTVTPDGKRISGTSGSLS